MQEEERRMIDHLSRLTLIIHRRPPVSKFTMIAIILIDDHEDEVHIYASLSGATNAYNRALKKLAEATRNVKDAQLAKQAEWDAKVPNISTLRRLEATEQQKMDEIHEPACKALEAQQILSIVERWFEDQMTSL